LLKQSASLITGPMINRDNGSCLRGSVGENSTLPGASGGNCITPKGNVTIA